MVWTKFIRLVEDCSRNISICHLSKFLQWNSNKCQFPLFPLATVSYHRNLSSYPIGTKIKLFIPLACRCYMWNFVRISFMASEEMLFENVDGRRMPTYTISSTMSLRLRWAKNWTWIFWWEIINWKKLEFFLFSWNGAHKCSPRYHKKSLKNNFLLQILG